MTAALLMVIVVDPMPAAFIAFQMGPELPSERPYNTVSRWRWKTKRTKRLPAARRSVSEMTGIVNPWPCSTRYRSTAIAGAAISCRLFGRLGCHLRQGRQGRATSRYTRAGADMESGRHDRRPQERVA